MDNHEKYKQYLLGKPYALLDHPFGLAVMVFKVKGKMFASVTTDRASGLCALNLKCDPDEALALRDIYDAITAGYHMNKMHWNTVVIDGSIAAGEIERMIDNSFNLVVTSLPKKVLKTMALIDSQA
ncbi:MAG: MmcQ/YjbR family DNA-binding protein [Gammaproteobacteria bacterium]|nr:MmcQ/YjbR family DNA-binding protein [Gammaproteobacteria bacterium]